MSAPRMNYNLDKLHKFVKGIGQNMVVKVGILGDKNARPTGAETNASIGLVHEMGSFKRHIPQRSFLRMPLFEKSAEIIKEASIGADKLLAEGNKLKLMERLGAACVGQIDEAFATKGFGEWTGKKANKKATIRAKLRRGGFKGAKLEAAMKMKDNDSPLIDTGELRRSISSKVEVK